MLARELAGQRIEVAHPLDSHQERFIPVEASFGEGRELIAKMSFQLLYVGTVNSLTAAQVRPPLRDLLFERSIGDRRHTVHAFIQIPLRVPSTAFHCSRWAASCARPSFVIR